MISPAMQKQWLEEAEALRQKVQGTITLPDLDLSGVPGLQLGNMVDVLVDIERQAGDTATREPFAERREDSQHCVWLRQPGVVFETIAGWAQRQLELIHTHIEAWAPAGNFERAEREVLLLTWYARRGDLAKAEALLTGPKWATAEQMADVVDAATDGRNRLDVLRMMVEGSTLSTSEKNAFHAAVRSADDVLGDVEGCLKDLHEMAREAA